MDIASKYWKICRINPANQGVGYECYPVPLAQDFFQKQRQELKTQKSSNLDHLQNEDIQAALLAQFQTRPDQTEPSDPTTAVQAGLCLRCLVSYPILKACKTIDSLFGGDKPFTYRDLLPFVLNDDGKALILLDKDGKTQLIQDKQGKTQTTAYKFFSVEVLRTFKPNAPTSLSLDNWAHLHTKQNPELKEFLSNFGFKHLSDWALLNRARPKQLERLSARERHLVEVFHAVYRRDRLQQRQQGLKRCPDPSGPQLAEMQKHLQDRKVNVKTPAELLQELKQTATQLRQFDIWSYREPLDIYDAETGNYALRPDLPYTSLNELELEQQELLEFLHQQLRIALVQAVEQEVRARIERLKNSRKYAPLTRHLIPGLQLYYEQGLSLKEITPRLGMSSWDQTRRVLDPGDLLNQVRERTVQQILDQMLKKAQAMGLTDLPPAPDYLKNLAEQVEAFADQEIFQAAATEIRAGKNRSLDSVYAQQLRSVLSILIY
ncbi:hypothetical protein [Leptolyngbya sp. FACHB-261]|uniref:hypothetical protein n=1 Tax=Leptolyngbya sp. FACHB-261 TaxID=2692806 RepID=UPI0016848EBD|nr:hypothetical protein [Leptolyngbya sp. FACHB-261]MBD2103045.1 hypothetical protein [Leptolyngbya sp. FACHB-261]